MSSPGKKHVTSEKALTMEKYMAEQCAVYIKKLSVTQKKKKTKLPYCK
jgi:hypothetical protein